MSGGFGGAWERRVDPSSKREYFFCREIGKSVWKLPEGAVVVNAAPASTAAAGGGQEQDAWEPVVDPSSKKTYYYNRRRRSSAWKLPDGAKLVDGDSEASAEASDWVPKQDPKVRAPRSRDPVSDGSLDTFRLVSIPFAGAEWKDVLLEPFTPDFSVEAAWRCRGCGCRV